jgi:hypothetical protein
MSFEVRDLMVKVLPLQAQGCDNQSCNLCETTPPDCTPCQTTGPTTGQGEVCQSPSQCVDCKETAGETCDNTCQQTNVARAHMGEETGPGLGMGLVLLQQQLRQTLDQAL